MASSNRLVLCIFSLQLSAIARATPLPPEKEMPDLPRIPTELGPVRYSVHYDDGSYQFGYDTGGGEHQSFRKEAGDPNGNVSGFFGHVREDRSLIITNYTSGVAGYRPVTILYRPTHRLFSHHLSPLGAQVPPPDTNSWPAN